jgi:hypothetical protein
MIVTATKYADVRTPRAARSGVPERAPALILPKPGECVSLPEWYWREMREGGLLYNYLQREKAATPGWIRQTAIQCRNFQQNNKSEFRRIASIPARTALRLMGEDREFFHDKKNIKNLKRDNPDMAIWL